MIQFTLVFEVLYPHMVEFYHIFQVFSSKQTKIHTQKCSVNRFERSFLKFDFSLFCFLTKTSAAKTPAARFYFFNYKNTILNKRLYFANMKFVQDN